MKASDIIDGLIAVSADYIWASELAFFHGARRIDFFTIQPTASQRFRTNAYEIKVSLSDYRRDSEEKQSGALKWCDRFWYVTPPGLLAISDLPDWAGLKEFDGDRFRIVRKAPPRQKAEPDWWFVVSLLRNSGDCRRDVSLLRSQIAFLQSRVDTLERQQRMASEQVFRRWIAKAQAREDCEGVPE